MVTTCHDFGVNYDSAHDPKVTKPYYYVSIGFASTRKVTPIIPLIYDIETHKEPYDYHFTIQGELTEIQSFNAYFILKDGSKELVPIDAELLNQKRTKESRKDHYYFSAGAIDFPFSWSQIDDLEMSIHFIAVDLEGNTIEHRENKKFHTYHVKETGNRNIKALIGL